MTVRMMKKAGGAPKLVDLPSSFFVSDTKVTPTNSVAQFNVLTNGTCTGNGTSVTAPQTWMVSGVASDYEVLAHVDSGTISGGDLLDQWLAITQTRSWNTVDTTTAGGPVSCSLSVTIRKIGAPAISDNVLVSLTAEKLINQ